MRVCLQRRERNGGFRRILTARALPGALCLLFAAGAAIAQSVVQSFDGDSGAGLAVCETGRTHCGFPDMNAAVNGKQVVQVTWQNVSVFDYSGHLLRATPLATFFRDAGLDPVPIARGATPSPARGPFELHVAYDEFIGRWIVSATGASESLMVSATSDPMGSWGGVSLSCLDGGPCLNYDPAVHLGYDKNGVYDCGAHIGDSNPNTVLGVSYDCVAVSSAEVQAIGRGKAPAHIHRAHNMPHEVLPAIDHNRDKAPGAPAFFLAKTCERTSAGGCQNALNSSFRWIVDTFTWNGAAGAFNVAGEQLVMTDVGSRQNKWLYSKPCCGPTAIFPQAGSDVGLRAAESHRLTNVVQFGSHLYSALGSGPCTAECGSQGTDTNNVAFFVDLDCTKTAACVVSQTAKLSGADLNPEFPSVGVDAAGNVGIVAISSSANSDLSILLWSRRKADPPNTLNGPTTLIAGTQPYTCETDRKFASISNPAGVDTMLDPSDGTKLWITEQWGNNAARCVWNTRVVEYQVAPAQATPAKRSKSKHE
jgi:hypothetical protein